MVRWVGACMVAAAARPKATLAWAAVPTVLSLLVILMVPPAVETDVQAGTFPIGDPQADAFRALRADVAGINSELVYLELKPGARASGVAVSNVTSYEAAQAIEELFVYVQSRFLEETGEPKVLDYTGHPHLIKLVHSYFPDGVYGLPETREEYDAANQVLFETDDGSLDFYFSDDYRATVFSILYDPAGDKAETAGLINEIIAEYRALAPAPGSGKTVDLWQEETMDAWGIQSWIYRVNEAVSRDVTMLVPIVLGVLGVLLLAAYRDWRLAAMTLLTVGLVLIWTLAAMTGLGLPIGFISMALFPLLLGVGVDYAIHVAHEVMSERRLGDLRGALRASGDKAGTALVVATATTVAGFLVIMLSRSPMIVQVATATIIGMILTLLASITVLPALLALRHRNLPRPRVENTWHVRWARTAGRRRGWTLLGVLVVSGLLVPFVPQTSYAIDTVQGNLPSRPEPSHMLVMYDRFSTNMGATGQESFIHQGDLTDPAVMDGIIRTHLAMEQEPFFGPGVLSMPFVVDLYLQLESGGLGPLATLPGALLPPAPGQPEPERFERLRALDQTELEATLIAIWDDVRWNPLVRSFTDRDFDITWTFAFLDTPADLDATKRADQAMQDILEAAGPQPATTHYFGTMTALKRINDQAATWLTLSAVVDLVVLAALVAMVTRNLRAVVASVGILALGMVWWLGLLAAPGIEIRLSFVYLIPLAFITSLGSDYAVHLCLAVKDPGRREHGFATVGRAVVFSAMTTAVAFGIFSFGSIRGSWQMFQASVIAILVSAVLTLVVVPAMFPPMRPNTSAPLDPS